MSLSREQGPALGTVVERPMERLEHRDVVSLHREVSGSGEAGRTGSHHGNLLAGRLRTIRFWRQRELPVDVGHIGMYVSSRARDTVPPAIAAWLAARPAD